MNQITRTTTRFLSVICISIFIVSLVLPVNASDGNQNSQGSGPGDHQGGTNGDQGNQNMQSGDGSSGSQNQHGNQNQGSSQSSSGNGHTQNQNGAGYQKRYQHRNLNCMGEHNHSRIRSQWKHNNTQDVFEIEFSTDPIPALTLQYMPTADLENIQLTFSIQLQKIIEFTDKNSNNRYDYSDTIESIYDFDAVEFTDIIYKTINQSTNISILQMRTQTTDTIFTMNLVIADNFTSFNNLYITPAEMKIDFSINNYSYQNNKSMLTLIIEIITEHNLSVGSESFDEKQGFASNESTMNINAHRYAGFFSWLDTILVDGQTKPVTVGYLKEESPLNQTNEGIQYISFTYPHGSNITHDPKIGVISESFLINAESDISPIKNLTDMDIYSSYLLSIILAACLFLGIIIIRKRF